MNLLIFVNDGSHDNTKQILEQLPSAPHVSVLHHKVNRGHGGALKTGIRCVTTPFLVTMDGDGKRDDRSSSNIHRQLGKSLIRAFTKLLMPLPITDLNSGFKLYRTELAQRYITVCPDSMAFYPGRAGGSP